jgi:hypothetical protein
MTDGAVFQDIGDAARRARDWERTWSAFRIRAAEQDFETL